MTKSPHTPGLRLMIVLCGFVVILPIASVAQNGWLSVAGGVQHSFYVGGNLGSISSPAAEFEMGLAYRQMLSDKVGVWFGWNYGKRSLSRSEAYTSSETRDLKFTYIENTIMLGAAIAAKRTASSQLHVNLGVGLFLPHGAWRSIHDVSNGVATDSNAEFRSPSRFGSKVGISYTRKMTDKISWMCAPYLVVVLPPKADYDSGGPTGQRGISLSELRTVLGIAIGVEFGPLFKGEQQKPE